MLFRLALIHGTTSKIGSVLKWTNRFQLGKVSIYLLILKQISKLIFSWYNLVGTVGKYVIFAFKGYWVIIFNEKNRLYNNNNCYLKITINYYVS